MNIYYATWQVGIKNTDGIKVDHQLTLEVTLGHPVDPV